jgi:hypothetical protein
MADILSRLSPAELPVVLCLGLLAVVVCVIGVARIVAGSLRRYRERQLATSVVLEMLNRQMPFDQIRDVILAMDMEDNLDRACTLRRTSEGVSIDPDPPNGEATYSVRLAMPSPQPTRLSARNAMWLPRRVAI